MVKQTESTFEKTVTSIKIGWLCSEGEGCLVIHFINKATEKKKILNSV